MYLSSLRTVKDKQDEEVIAYVSTFNPRNTEAYGHIRENLKVLQRDTHVKNVLQSYKFIKSKRQERNLKKLLTRAKFAEKPYTPTVTRCNRPKCDLCKHLIEGESFTFKCGRVFKVRSDISCDVKNVIYVIKCGGCDREYI